MRARLALRCVLVLMGALMVTGAWADQPGSLSHGINITGWFRFPPSRDPAVLGRYMSDQALDDLRAAGFDFVRLAIDPAVITGPSEQAVLIEAIRRIQHHELTVVVSAHPQNWHLEIGGVDRDRLRDFWRKLAPALRPLDPARTVPEVLNEPVFPGDADGWAALQHQILGEIRRALPKVTVVLTGHDWGSIKGLMALTPEDDPNVLYSFHFYDPPELTSLAAYRAGLDRSAMARLPFPVNSQIGCEGVAGTTTDAATRDMVRYYCKLDWTEEPVERLIGQAAAWATRNHVHLLAGEFGASAALNPAARFAWLRTVRQALAAHGIPWALWGYDDVMGFAVERPPALRPRLDPDVLSALGLTTRLSLPVSPSLTRLVQHDQ